MRGDDLKTAIRDDAALAATGQGKDRPNSTTPMEPRKPANRAKANQTLRHRQQDSNLAGIRDDEALAKLPEAERREWQGLWADVAAILARVDEPGSPAVLTVLSRLDFSSRIVVR